MINPYIGHESQLYGVEEHRLLGGKGDNMRLLQVKNGKGLEFTVSVDRGADISRVSLQGCNLGYFAACGYVAPSYYDEKGYGFLKSFTTGFLTTCGLRAVGTPCSDDGEELPLHGTINHIPAEQLNYEVTENEIIIRAEIHDERIFGPKLVLLRKMICSLQNNTIKIIDKVENRGDTETPLMLLYHLNMGYPLLSEKAELSISSKEVKPRNKRAAQDLSSWNQILPPQKGFEEQCYYHTFEKEGTAGIYNHEVGKGLMIRFDSENLDYFTQWKMMGYRDYVMGLEPGNCHPDGRDVMRKDGTLKYIQPGEIKEYQICIEFIDDLSQWERVK